MARRLGWGWKRSCGSLEVWDPDRSGARTLGNGRNSIGTRLKRAAGEQHLTANYETKPRSRVFSASVGEETDGGAAGERVNERERWSFGNAFGAGTRVLGHAIGITAETGIKAG